jgi:acyl-[acyl-carrier-protein] desaturase
VEAALYQLYREFFDRAEAKRRWSLRGDIPWEQCNRALDPAIADVVESFCAVELYANWGYEESKHSLALGDWLLRSGMRSEEQMTDLQDRVFQWEWTVPHGNPVGMLAYAMAQELATGLNYRNLRRHVDEQSDPALSKLLGFLSIDEQAHHNFFLKAVRVFLEHDRPGTLKEIRSVLHGFAMPAIYQMADGRRRVEAIKSLGVFNDELYFHEVYQPILAALGVSRPELRRAG